MPPDVQQFKRNPYKFTSENAPAVGKFGGYTEKMAAWAQQALPPHIVVAIAAVKNGL
jgi:hypothetical protein